MLTDRGERIKDERVHAFLLIQNELLRLANASWERKYTTLLENTSTTYSLENETFNFNRPLFINAASNKKPINPILAALIPEKPVIIESSLCHQLVAEKYEYICLDIIQQKFSRQSYVQQTLMILLPRLAAFNKEIFVKKHLPGVMNLLFNATKGREKDRSIAFTTIGM